MPVFHNTDNICNVLEGHNGWHQAANDSAKKHQVPVHLQLAIIAQESGFKANARPPGHTLLGINVPGTNPTTAYGYPQAIDDTWGWYKKDTGNHNASRTNFADSVDFVGWYINQSSRLCGIAKSDAYHQYLAYHEGQGNFNKKSYLAKNWLMKVAKNVKNKANEYEQQLKNCPLVSDNNIWHWNNIRNWNWNF